MPILPKFSTNRDIQRGAAVVERAREGIDLKGKRHGLTYWQGAAQLFVSVQSLLLAIRHGWSDYVARA